FSRDWSSDVCSSDLLTERVGENSFVDMLDGRVNVFLGRGNAALTVTKVLIHVANVRICPAKAPNDKSSGTDRPSRSFLHNPYRRISGETAIPCISAWAIPSRPPCAPVFQWCTG